MTAVKEKNWLSDFDLHLFGEGKHYSIYEKLGAHLTEREGQSGVYFAVWAPHAQKVGVVGDFNNWDNNQSPMKRNQMGIWEAFVPGLTSGEKYKYAIENAQGHCCLKTDPYGYQQELRPATASIVTDLSYSWQDESWLAHRSQANPDEMPISIYEVHLGSWLHSSLETPPESGQAVPVSDKPGARFLTYRELADKLIPYVKEVGYTHIELLPITEHPFDGSWGYQVVGYYAPTSRYGTPQDFMYFIDRCHQAGIGVLIDWVPGHFPKDAHGLAGFDGTSLYEYEDWRKGEHKGWGTLVFNYERYEVRNFLIASALFWFEKYHIDGIRVDAVASMLYLDYEREEWIGNAHGGRENLEAVEFLRQLNEAIFQHYPGVLSIAEESTTWEKVSHPIDIGGLGFNFKWNMGWMNDTLSYFHVHSQDRSNVHNKLTFSIWYAFTEKFMLALSHDEVVHGKGHLWQKMPGDDSQKMANLRGLFAYMFTHPGKKTLFMGMEFGQTREWNVNGDLDWWLLESQSHQQLHQLVKDLHQIYHAEPALYTDDFTNEGFEWIDCNDMPRGMITYLRKDKYSDEVLIVVCNFKPNVYQNYWVGVREPGAYQELINTDDKKYGGNGQVNPSLEARQWNSSPWAYALEITVPALSVMIFKKS
ncbi:MAG: 1,4-alpha-glucan branching protein GlgB [Xenococcaceae cyanobacterium MO_167.B52]|nr:1,4-alpha-glucan branching protein GlgB [Xenococcaceae cyanobacterium MO_167.B52]